jgi:integrase
MARAINKLTEVAVRAAKRPGRLSDGGNLFLRISPSRSKSWSFMWNVDGKRSELGLGAYPAVSLAEARRTAHQYREVVAKGGNPKSVSERQAVPTFAECVDLFLDTMEGQWSNTKHRGQWRMTLTTYCEGISSMQVSKIGLHDVLSVLQPIWNEKPETASRLRGRIERVLNFAKVKGWREGENPAMWRGNLENVLPKPAKLTRGHHSAMPYADVPEFIERLREHEAVAARALEFLILTACRSGEVLKAQWSEIDLDARVFTVPAHRMKARKEHRVPLTDAAMAILEPLYEGRNSDWVFPGHSEDKPLSDMAMEMLLRRMKQKTATVHGFRSSFRDWAGDCTSFPREIAEAALAHKVGDSVELAYRRSDALEKRREIMQAWARFCANALDAKVVSFPI